MRILFEKNRLTHPLIGAVETLLTNSKSSKALPMTFAELRTALGKAEKDLPDGVIHQVALDLGLEVVPE